MSVNWAGVGAVLTGIGALLAGLASMKRARMEGRREARELRDKYDSDVDFIP